MAKGTVGRITIDDLAVTRLTSVPGGDVWAFMQKFGTQATYTAVLKAPARTGTLKRSHNLALTPRGTDGVRASVGNYADHMRYVHEGTTGPIFANGWDDGSPAFLAIRPMPASRFGTTAYRRSVAGQTANPWMREAVEEVAHAYGFPGSLSLSTAAWG